jgi:hypothetical protein
MRRKSFMKDTVASEGGTGAAERGGAGPRIPGEVANQAERQGFERQRLEPQDQPPAGVLDDENLAGEKDFELKPPGGKQ